MILDTKNQNLAGLLVFVMIVGLAGLARAETLHVPSDYRFIKDALLNASPGDRVSIAPGLYREYNLQIPPGVTLEGAGAGPDEVVIDGHGQGRIMLCESLDTATIIMNLTFTGGAAKGPCSYDRAGGAILLSHSNPRILNCVFRGNLADSHGGAIRCSRSSPQIINCRFEDNAAPDGGGGALDCSYDSNPIVTGATFIDNSALWGGAVSCRAGSRPTLYGCIFATNSAKGIPGLGGGMLVDFDAAPSVVRGTFYNNMARDGGALAIQGVTQMTLEQSTLVANTCEDRGGGIACSESEIAIDNCILAYHGGSAVICENDALPLISCTNIWGNRGGDWEGMIGPQLEMKGNISADPRFSHFPPLNAYEFYLAPDSPSGPNGGHCGLMGAWGVAIGLDPIGEIGMDAPAGHLKSGGRPDAPGEGAGRRLVGAHPNPFNPRTHILLDLPQPQMVLVTLHDLAGRQVRRLIDEWRPAGPQELLWDGRDEQGHRCQSGLYFVRVLGEDFQETGKLTLLK